MMEAFHIISYKNDKVFETSLAILEILALTLGIVVLMMSLLLPDKHCIGEIRVFHEKRTYKFGRK